jgi:hypothetical protein
MCIGSSKAMTRNTRCEGRNCGSCENCSGSILHRRMCLCRSAKRLFRHGPFVRLWREWAGWPSCPLCPYGQNIQTHCSSTGYAFIMIHAST